MFVLNVYVMPLVLPFFIFMHLHLAYHLGALDERCEGCDVGAEPEDGVWWIYPEDGRTKQVLGPEMSPGREMLTCERRLTNTDSVWDPREAPEHSKSPTL